MQNDGSHVFHEYRHHKAPKTLWLVSIDEGGATCLVNRLLPWSDLELSLKTKKSLVFFQKGFFWRILLENVGFFPGADFHVYRVDLVVK